MNVTGALRAHPGSPRKGSYLNRESKRINTMIDCSNFFTQINKSVVRIQVNLCFVHSKKRPQGARFFSLQH